MLFEVHLQGGYGHSWIFFFLQDVSGNVTRFVMLAREPIIPGKDRPFKVCLDGIREWCYRIMLCTKYYCWLWLCYYQTSIVFALDEGPGVLFKALSAFALRDINLVKVSCPFDASCCVPVSVYWCILFFRHL